MRTRLVMLIAKHAVVIAILLALTIMALWRPSAVQYHRLAMRLPESRAPAPPSARQKMDPPGVQTSRVDQAVQQA